MPIKPITALTLSTALALSLSAASAQDMPGITKDQIKIGNLAPLSGPASAYATITKTIAAYFKMVNDKGGINGRKVDYTIVDDGYSPPKAVAGARRLVEQDGVAFVFQPLGTANNMAIRNYMNGHEVPQLFVATGATAMGDYKDFPWTMGWQPNYGAEARVYAEFLKSEHPGSKVAILYQNDDYGQDITGALKKALEGSDVSVVAEEPYETSDPTVDSQVVNLKASGADAFLVLATPKFAAQAIKAAASQGWDPKVKIVNQVANSIAQVLKPAGEAASKGYVSVGYLKDPLDDQFKDDPAVKDWGAFMDKYYPDGPKTSSFTTYGYSVAQTLEQVLKQAGDDLSRKNIMKEAANLKDFKMSMALPGILVNTSPTDYYPIEQMQLMRYEGGDRWHFFGDVIDGSRKEQ